MGRMAKEFLIGTDIGTSGTKSILVDLEGRIVASFLVEYGIITPQALWAEQWPKVWLNAVKKTIRKIMDNSGVEPDKVAGICISGLYGGSGVPCDADMNPVRPCIIWMDRRAEEECRWLQDRIGLDRILEITGNGIDPYFGYTKILWIKNNEPENWTKIQQFLPPNAYVINKLTGKTAIDYSSAGNLGGIYDMRKHCWSEDLMKEMGIPSSIMPQKMVDPCDITGELSKSAAEELGLLAGTPVCAGTIDCLAATLSAGVTESGQHVAVLGTSLNWGLVHEEFPMDKSLVTMPYAKDPKTKFYTYGGASTAGALPRWFRDNFAELEKLSESSGEGSAYAALDESCKNILPGSDGLLILPYFMGERSPIWDSNARGTILGLTLYHSKAHVYRAILESVAYSLRHIMESFQGGVQPGGECTLVGGAAKSSVWKQIFADVTGLSIICPKRDVEAPLGDAFLAGMGTGVLKDYSEIKSWVEFGERVMPNRENHQIYTEYFEQYKKLYPVLSGSMKQLAETAVKYKNHN